MRTKPYTDKEWIYNEYVVNNRSARELSKELHVSYKLIQIYVEKFGYPVRNENKLPVGLGDDDVVE